MPKVGFEPTRGFTSLAFEASASASSATPAHVVLQRGVVYPTGRFVSRGARVGRAVMDEADLIARSQKGNVSAFNQLVLAYQELAYNVALRILGEPEAAADATQEAFLSAFRSVAGFRGGSFRAWLLRIVTNACYDDLRARKRRPAESLDEIVVEEEESQPSLSSRFESPEEHALRMDVQAEVQRCLGLLPLEQRTTLVLSDVHGLSYDEIAAVTNSSLGTVKSRLSRGRAAMRDLLRQRELLPSTERL